LRTQDDKAGLIASQSATPKPMRHGRLLGSGEQGQERFELIQENKGNFDGAIVLNCGKTLVLTV